jgi:antitoxin VapB
MPAPARKRHRTLPEGSAEIVEGKLFQTGRSQALRIPAAFRFPGDAVYMKKWRGTVVLIPKDDPWRSLVESVGRFPEDYLADWVPVKEPQHRPGLTDLFD